MTSSTIDNSSLTSSIPALPYLIVYGITILLLSVFIFSLIDPRTICAAALFPQPADKPLHTFFYLFAVRELVLGLALLLLEAYGEWRAVVVVLGCVGINGVGDFFIAGFRMGSEEGAEKGRQNGGGSAGRWWASFKAHGVPTIFGYWAVWKLWQEHW
jgi:hypothetical protein